MQQIFGKAVLLATTLAALGPGATIDMGPSDALRSATIFVRIYDYAGIPSHIQSQAKAHAEGVFKRAGFDLIWLPDPLNSQDLATTAVSAKKLDDARSFGALAVRIYPPEMSRRLGRDDNVFGYALQPEDEGRFGTTAIVFDERAQSLAREGIASRAVALGHVIAHEIGHLLLGHNSHAGSGIMRVPWRRADLKRAATGLLNFTPEQTARMRNRQVARTRTFALRAAAITE